MTTHDRKHVSDDEYQFPQEEYIGASSGDAATVDSAESADVSGVQDHAEGFAAHIADKSNRLDFFKKHKRMVFIVGGAILVLILFKIMTGDHHQKVIVQKPVAKVTHKQPSQFSAQLGNLKQDQMASQESINAVQTQIQGMHSALSQMSAQNKNVDQALIALADQIKTLTTEVKAQKHAPVKKGPPSPELIYHVRAVIPGRAWIIGSNRLTQSVTVGDHVPDYGTVTGIDSMSGTITTSSGKKIVLGANDY